LLLTWSTSSSGVAPERRRLFHSDTDRLLPAAEPNSQAAAEALARPLSETRIAELRGRREPQECSDSQ